LCKKESKKVFNSFDNFLLVDLSQGEEEKITKSCRKGIGGFVQQGGWIQMDEMS
jgi:hypothetical protein